MPTCPNCDSHDTYESDIDEMSCGDCGYTETY